MGSENTVGGMKGVREIPYPGSAVVMAFFALTSVIFSLRRFDIKDQLNLLYRDSEVSAWHD